MASNIVCTSAMPQRNQHTVITSRCMHVNMLTLYWLSSPYPTQTKGALIYMKTSSKSVTDGTYDWMISETCSGWLPIFKLLFCGPQCTYSRFPKFHKIYPHLSELIDSQIGTNQNVVRHVLMLLDIPKWILSFVGMRLFWALDWSNFVCLPFLVLLMTCIPFISN